MSHCTKCNREIPKPRVSLDVSEITEKLRTQYGSSVAQLAEVSRIVEDIEKDVADYQKEILRMQGHILLLTSKCDRAQSLKRRVQGLTSPIRRLPNEILVRILEYSCAKSVFDSLAYPVGSASPWLERVDALAASAVCSRWRQLALSTPQLWASFSVSVTGSEEDYKKECHLAGIINLFLRRSGEHPLSVDLDLAYWNPYEWNDESDDHPADHPVIEAVLCHARRLQTLTHSVEALPLAYNGTVCDPAHSFPILQRATLSQSEDYGSTRHAVPLFHNSPNLKELTVHGMYKAYDASGNADWLRIGQQLTYLDIQAVWPDFFKVIGLCCRLSTLRLDVAHYYHARAPKRPVEPLELPTLRSLHMRVMDGPSDRFPDDMVRMILSSLTTPSLEELAIGPERDLRLIRDFDRDYSGPWPGEQILGLLQRSKCALTKVTLKIRVTGYQLVNLLHHLGSLRELSVDGRHTDVEIARFLIPRLHGFDGGSIQPLVPRLARLSIVISGTQKENNFDEGKCVDMVISRWNLDSLCGSDSGLACLKSVNLRFPEMEVDSDAYKSLRILENLGLDLNLTGKSPIRA